jgi:carboxyl-terminal processing protease
VTRLSLLLLLILVSVPVRGQPPVSGAADEPAFDPHTVTAVFVEALGFMEPRTLDPAPVSRMTAWGLRGLTALDPRLTVSMSNGRLRVAPPGQAGFEVMAPRDESVVAWANTAVALAVGAARFSAPVREASSQAVIQNFFDELFNHLDPYSRYVGPAAATEERERREGRAGIGIGVSVRGGAAVVTAVIRDSPAEAMGVRTGDTIIAVDRKPVRGLDARAVMGLVDGEEDTAVQLSWRGQDGRVREASTSTQ